MEHELLRILSILNIVQRPSEARELLRKFSGTAINEDSYESWRIAIKTMIEDREKRFDMT